MAPVPPPAPIVEVTADAPPPRPTLRERLFRPRLLIAAALLAMIPVLGPWVRRQIPDLTQRPEYRMRFQDVLLIPPATDPLPVDFIEQVRRRADLPSELPLLDPDLPLKVATAFAAHPWVERVDQVSNQAPALVTVKLQYRRVVALVEVPDGLYPIDPQGILLPPQDFTPDDARDYLVVRGITSIPFGAAGKPWGDPAVAAAAALADFIGPRWKELQLTAIVAPRITSASTQPDDVLLELESTGGSRIQWGRKPGSTYPGELEAGQKVGRLDKYLREFGSYHQPQGPYAIDIRHWHEITRKPLVDPRFTATRKSPNRR
ncbi:MAG: hypothetical protein SH850_19025 [Planctomycetaceae bacterium]|nr:hypothetical protein [Planctomycetaceae bacterium]